MIEEWAAETSWKFRKTLSCHLIRQYPPTGLPSYMENPGHMAGAFLYACMLYRVSVCHKSLVDTVLPEVQAI